ncbi:transcriptional repressor [Microvirga terricola]|uniref:Ferric uptake regulation protein n=1 Tax=Microvirga terricola TaxID=2719797 RepID=A0ABX0VDT8_9HYPH|nr:transcriptional repressor [Microvirga terricola]NIX76032.1 hypothetical protein [Microvirga terricola]
MNFTPMRQRVYREIAVNGSIGAYEIAHNLSSLGKQVNVTSIYRALDFLLSGGLIYKVNLSKKFAVAPLAEAVPSAVNMVLICKATGLVTKVYSSELEEHIAQLTRKMGFSMTRAVVEIEGDGNRPQLARSAS